MSITGINGVPDSSVYSTAASPNRTEQEGFTEALVAVSEQEGEVVGSERPESRYAGYSLMDLFNSGMARQQIPVVNQIVTAKNPVDGKIYVTCFTDNRISCNDATGKRIWDMELGEGEKDIVSDFFSNYKPTRDIVKEYYSDPRMGAVSSKDFWMSLFEDRKKYHNMTA